MATSEVKIRLLAIVLCGILSLFRSSRPFAPHPISPLIVKPVAPSPTISLSAWVKLDLPRAKFCELLLLRPILEDVLLGMKVNLLGVWLLTSLLSISLVPSTCPKNDRIAWPKSWGTIFIPPFTNTLRALRTKPLERLISSKMSRTSSEISLLLSSSSIEVKINSFDSRDFVTILTLRRYS